VRGPLPERLLLPLVGLSERTGCVIFRLLRDKGLELFADEPEVAERIRVLYDDILADESSVAIRESLYQHVHSVIEVDVQSYFDTVPHQHVGLIEARLGGVGRALLRALYRLLAARMVRSMSPETRELLGAETLGRALRAPFRQARLAAEFPQTAYAF
jgi:hypothetical protein